MLRFDNKDASASQFLKACAPSSRRLNTKIIRGTDSDGMTWVTDSYFMVRADVVPTDVIPAMVPTDVVCERLTSAATCKATATNQSPLPATAWDALTKDAKNATREIELGGGDVVGPRMIRRSYTADDANRDLFTLPHTDEYGLRVDVVELLERLLYTRAKALLTTRAAGQMTADAWSWRENPDKVGGPRALFLAHRNLNAPELIGLVMPTRIK